MPRDISVMDWDSRFFGFGVAAIALPHGGDVRAYVPALRESRTRLAYIFVDPHDTEGQHSALAAGAQLTDCRLTYQKTLVTSVELALDSAVHSLLGEPPTPDLEKLAQEAGTFSRFRVDPNFAPGVYEQLFSLWLRRSMTGEIAQEVYGHLKVDGTVDGIVSLSTSGASAKIGLIAVHASARGRSIGSRLIGAAEFFCAKRGLTLLEVITQKRNVGACRFYERTGFGVISEKRIYHLWLNG